ncbi:MAG: MFS transporter [Flavobacteriales bacterium]|nr:MFS transporter [Flavobacteriales bacterium]MCB9166542.1 MFS transporter [Flavobacteriales bacterium]
MVHRPVPHVLARAVRYYVDSFRDLRREVWLLALITFVNRAGSMVVPFLSLYLTKDMGLTLEQVGWIMSCFGAGSVVGSWLGGKLSDKLGFYDVMVGALIASGLAFIGLQFVRGFAPFCAGVFLLMVLADAFRPGMYVAIRAYARPADRTRAVSLIRLAINLGFGLGPAIGGLLIATWSYAGLFWVDGLTSLAAAGILWTALPRRQARTDDRGARSTGTRSPYRDGPFLFMLVILVFVGVAFLQYFSTVPIFYSEVHGLDERAIGILLGLNGLVIFLTEMPLIKYCGSRGLDPFRILRFSVWLIALSFVLLYIVPAVAFLWVGILLMTVGEMLNFPFMNRLAYERADKGPPGAYMALFTIGWSVAHLIGHTAGLDLIAHFGFTITWYFFTGVLLLAVGMLYLLERMVRKESEVPGTA